jgi:phosphoribosylformylglycinamidine (FGAM) synthase-like enzyme
VHTAEDRWLEDCAALFNEAQSRIIISVAPKDCAAVKDVLLKRQVPFQEIGYVGDENLTIEVGHQLFSWPIAELHDHWFNAIQQAVEGGSNDRIQAL